MISLIDRHISINLVHIRQNGSSTLLLSRATHGIDIRIRDLHSGDLAGDRSAASTPPELFLHETLQFEVKEVDVGGVWSQVVYTVLVLMPVSITDSHHRGIQIGGARTLHFSHSLCCLDRLCSSFESRCMR